MQYKHIFFCIVTFFVCSSIKSYYRYGYIGIETNYIASDYYCNKTHQFLKHLKVANSEQVPVHLIIDYPILLSEKEQRPPCKLGCANRHGIWLNEKVLEDSSVDNRLFTIAHEAAHYALEHDKKNEQKYKKYNLITRILTLTGIGINLSDKRELLYIEQKLLSNNNKNNSQLKRIIRIIRTGIFSGLIYGISYFVSKKKLKKFRIEKEKEADKIATYLLCDLGHESVVQKRIEDLYSQIKSGYGNWTDGKHPTIEQEYNYLKKYLKRWKTKYAYQPSAAYIKS